MTPAMAREIAIYPDRWASYYRTLDGMPFSLEERPYLRDIYRLFSPENGKSNAPRVVILKCSRKVEKTETILNLLLYAMNNMPYFKAVYTAPRQPTVSRFIEERFKGALRSSIDGGCLLNNVVKDSITHMTFDVGMDRLNHLYAYSGWGDAHSLLGLDADMVCIDEYQDMQNGSLEMIQEIVTQSPWKWVLVSGTAREEGSAFWKLWNKSTQNHWNAEKQEWEQKNDSADGTIVGFHMDQRMHPDITQMDLNFKKEAYGTRKFVNEVLGEFYAGGLKPLTVDTVLSCVDRDLDRVRSVTPPEETFMGIDWGSETVLTIIDVDGNVKDARKIDSRSEDEVEVIKSLILRYNCKQVVADLGYGARQVKQLQEEFGDRVRSCYYASRPKTPFEFTKRDGKRNLIYMITVDRTTYMEDMIDRFEKQEVRIPWKTDELNWVVEQCCALNSTRETDENSTRAIAGSTRTRYGRDGDDHAFHALLYAFLAREVGSVSEMPMMRTFGGLP